MEQDRDTLWTIGHSTRAWEDFEALLRENAIACLVDVRRFAGSRRNPQYSPASMAPALEAAGIEYLPMPDFGGRRKADPDSANGAWRVAAFRGYADYMATPAFALARERLMGQARARPTAVMCAEAVWWRCHRRIIADHVLAHGIRVVHLLTARKHEVASMTAFAVAMGALVSYPAATSRKSRS